MKTRSGPPTLSDSEELLTDVLGVIQDNERKDLEEKRSVEESFIEELFDLRCSDLPVIYNFELFEEEVYKGIQVFDQIEEIEKRDHSMMEMKLASPSRKPKKQVLHECKFCSKVFMYLSEFTEHEKSYQKDISCDICGKILRSASHLVNHKNHHNPGLLGKPCEVCREVLCQCQGGGVTRGEAGTKIKSFCCKSCGAVFDSRSLLVRHQKLQHKLHKTSKVKKTLGSSKHIEWRKTSGKDLTRAL